MYLQYKVSPFKHQKEILERTKDEEYWAIFAEMGTGKTMIALVQAAYLFNCGKIKQVLIISKNGVDQQIIDEAVPQHLPLLPNQFLADCWRDYDGSWPKLKKFAAFTDNKLTIAALNCEALGTAKGLKAVEVYAKAKPTLLIVDESQEFAGYESKRTKNLLKIAPLFPYRRLMSGTPTGGNPTHYYSQMMLLSDKIFPYSKFSFEYLYCVKEKQSTYIKAPKDMYGKDKSGKWTLLAKKGTPYRKYFDVVTGYKNLDKLQATVSQYSSRVTKDECLDLPPKIYKKITFKLSDEEQALYNRVRRSSLAELAPGKFVSTEMAITKLLRLQQIACGFVTYEDLITGEKAKTLLQNPTRLLRLMEWSEKVQGKGIIWSRFTTSIDQIEEELKKNYGEKSVVRYDGTVGSNERHTNKISFKTDDNVRWFVGHPGAGGVGVDIPEASDTAYYSNDYKLMTRLQSEDRNHRIGTKQSVTYSDFVAEGTVDNKILTALRAKFDIATQLTGDQLREWIS